MRDLTAIGLSVAGVQVATAGRTNVENEPSAAPTRASGDNGKSLALAFTGADTGDVVLAAVLVLMAGTILVLASRRRRWKVAGSGPS